MLQMMGRIIDPSKVRPDLYDADVNTPSIELSSKYKLRGSCSTLSTGCTGTDSWGLVEVYSRWRCDIMICGAAGADYTDNLWCF